MNRGVPTRHRQGVRSSVRPCTTRTIEKAELARTRGTAFETEAESSVCRGRSTNIGSLRETSMETAS
jgi:hypothetical protein